MTDLRIQATVRCDACKGKGATGRKAVELTLAELRVLISHGKE